MLGVDNVSFSATAETAGLVILSGEHSVSDERGLLGVLITGREEGISVEVELDIVITDASSHATTDAGCDSSASGIHDGPSLISSVT